MKKVSLVAALKNREKDLELSLRDLVSFTKKFPLRWELILVIDPSQDQTLRQAQKFQADGFEVQVLSSLKSRGRARSIQEGLKASSGDYVVIFPVDFTLPLAEVFHFLQELVTQPELDLVLGNRMTSRKKWQSQKSSWHWTLEKILQDKLRSQNLPVQDPLCSYFAINRKGLDLLLPQLKLRGWYYMPNLLSLALRQNLKITEVPVLSVDKRESQIPLLKEYLRHLF